MLLVPLRYVVVLVTFVAFAACLGARSEDDLSQWKQLSKEGTDFYQAGRFKEAERAFRESLAFAARVFPETDVRVGASHNNLAIALSERGDFRQAEEHYKKALSTYEQSVGKEHLLTGRALVGLGDLYREEKKYDAAEQALRNAVKICSALGEEGRSDLATSQAALAILFNRMGRIQEALATCKAAYELTASLYGRDSVEAQSSKRIFAGVLKDSGRRQEAVAVYREVLARQENLLPKDHPDIGMTKQNLAVVLFDLNALEGVEKLYLESFEVLEKAYGWEHPKVQMAAVDYLQFAEHQGLTEIASKLKTKISIQKAGTVQSDRIEREESGEKVPEAGSSPK